MRLINEKAYFLKAIIYPIVFTVLIFFAWSLFITYGNFKMSSVPAMVNVVAAIAVFMGGFICGRGSSKKGLLMGMLGAVIYMIVSVIISFAFNGMIGLDFSLNTVIKFFTGIFIGAVGGVVGINFTSKPKRKLR